MKIRQHIPNLLTLGNLACGVIAIILIATRFDETLGVFLLFLAAIFDVFDGAVARKLGVSGELGKQLDSLADVVSFGVAPSIIIFKMLENSLEPDFAWMKYFAVFNALCAAWRLAHFNLSHDQHKDFRGMPSPANGLLWASLLSVFAFEKWYDLNNLAFTLTLPTSLLFTLLIATSMLMISDVRMFSFKFEAGGIRANKIQFVFVILMVAMLTFAWIQYHNPLIALPFCLMLYIVLSLYYHFFMTEESAD
ncbi:MAG: CDP-diacylglycerol--serine O-phosphatidyltransferase [Flavobacteriales bacterium]